MFSNCELGYIGAGDERLGEAIQDGINAFIHFFPSFKLVRLLYDMLLTSRQR
jgi:hypothetical protein